MPRGTPSRRFQPAESPTIHRIPAHPPASHAPPAYRIELGVPVANVVPGDGRVAAGTLPAGRYATLVYTGVRNGVVGSKALLEWGAEQGLAWDRWETRKGDAFGARLETYLTDPADEPDPAKWETEVAIRLADAQPQS